MYLGIAIMVFVICAIYQLPIRNRTLDRLLYITQDARARSDCKKRKNHLVCIMLATMILPFSSMQFATAEETTTVDTTKAEAQKIAKKILQAQKNIAGVEKKIEASIDETQTAKLEAKLDELNAELDRLEQKLTEKIKEISHVVSSSASEDHSSVAAKNLNSNAYSSSPCYGLINEKNDCETDMIFNGHTVTFIQPIDNYTTETCPTGSPTAICANFVYEAYDIPAWYQEGNDFYFYSSGYTNTCTHSGICSTWAVVVRLPDGSSGDITMTNAPTGMPMKTTWYLYYQGLFWGQTDSNVHIQNLADGYDPTP